MDFNTLLKGQIELQEEAGIIWGGEGYAIRNIDAAIVEFVEAKQLLNWKYWRKDIKDFNRDEFLEEMVDALQFWANVMNAFGYTAEDIEFQYDRNTDKVVRRIERGQMGG